jgi:hypothetical protein
MQAVGFPGSDVEGRRLAVDDAAADDTNGPGLVRVFAVTADDESWVQIGEDIEFPTGGTPALFGYSVALDATGLVIAIGAPGFNDNRGVVAALFLDLEENRWRPFGNAMLGNNEEGERFGTSVSISANGDVIAVGAPGQDTGFAKVFYLDETSDEWEQFGQDLVGEETDDQCGCDVSLSAGTVFFYHTDSEDFVSDWSLYGDPIDGILAGEECGFSLELSDDGVVYGCPGRNASPPAGVIRVALYTDDEWQQVGPDIDSAGSRVSVGSSVAISQNSEIIAFVAEPTSATASGSRVIAVTFKGDRWLQVGETIELGVDSVVPISLDLDSTGTTVVIGFIGDNDPGTAQGYILTLASPIAPPTSRPISRPTPRPNAGMRPTSRPNAIMRPTSRPNTRSPNMAASPTGSPAPSVTNTPTITGSPSISRSPSTLAENQGASTSINTPSSLPSQEPTERSPRPPHPQTKHPHPYSYPQHDCKPNS